MGAIYRHGWRMRHIPVFGIVPELKGDDVSGKSERVADLMEDQALTRPGRNRDA